MQRIATADVSQNLFGVGKHGFTDGNQAGGQNATQLNADWFNSSQEEVCNVIESCGIALSAATRTQLATAIQTGKLIAANAAGTANALTASFTPAIAALTNGMTLVVRAALANTGAATIVVNGGANIAIVKDLNQALIAGDIQGAGHWLVLVYDATLLKFVLRNPAMVFASTAEAQAQTITNRLISPNLLSLALKGANQSLTANGYQKFPGGLILQWMSATESGNAATEVPWPIPFPTACLAAVTTPNMTGVAIANPGGIIYSLSATGIIFMTGAAFNDGQNSYVIAIGH